MCIYADSSIRNFPKGMKKTYVPVTLWFMLIDTCHMTGIYYRINNNVTGTEHVYKVWDIVTTCIRHTSSYDMIMPSIYMIYTKHIPNGKDIYLVYIWYISGISHLSWYIPGLCFNSTCWLVLMWWALPHTAWHSPIPPVYMKIHWFQIPSSGIWYMTGIYQVYATYWARGPDQNRRGTNNQQEAEVSLAFIGLVPCLNTNGTFKHQQH
jgi:hypothetical protein